jgi:hypothetical protein
MGTVDVNKLLLPEDVIPMLCVQNRWRLLPEGKRKLPEEFHPAWNKR